MESEQELEWLESQKIKISVDLIAAAKRHLQFLAVVDRNRWLYEGPALERAIYRYNACWLPLLAKHTDSQTSDEPLVVPLDCEWVWHCHRLNPVRYKSDCEELYGKILDSFNVVSSIHGACKRHSEEIWNKLYPDEPYDFDLTRALSEDISARVSRLEKGTKYDLISAVKRQSPFFYQVSRTFVVNDLFLEEAVARYMGFLHLIKRNRERSIKHFSVPTYDVDLMWHTHQLHPASYCKDLSKLLGKVLEHDDMDSDRTKGKKLDVGFSVTTEQWEEIYGLRYWRAGAMYRGNAPAPITNTPCIPKISKEVTSTEFPSIIQLKGAKVVEVLLEIVGVRNLPEGPKGTPFVLFSKTQPDIFFDAQRQLSILSETGEKQVAWFQCEPTGELIFELFCQAPSSLPMNKSRKAIGSTSLSLQEFLSPVSRLSVEKWLELMPASGHVSAKPISLRIGVSFTIPVPAPHSFHMIRPHPLSTISCCFSLPGRIQHSETRATVLDEYDTELISLHMRDPKKSNLKDNRKTRMEVIGVTASYETHILAEYVGDSWCLLGSCWSLGLPDNSSNHDHLCELNCGRRIINLFLGRRLEYEPKRCTKQKIEQKFVTAVEFSAEQPYGKAVALFNVKSGFIKVEEECLVLPMITTAFILFNVMAKAGYEGFKAGEQKLLKID